MRLKTTAVPAFALAAGLAAALSGCGGVPTNRSMYSVHQPVVETRAYSLDVTTGGMGLAYGEQDRLAGWFEAMNLKQGDRIAIDDPQLSPATRDAVEAAAARYGAVVADATSTGSLAAGTARITIARARAYVPGCPDWSAKSDFNPGNATSTNYGCAVNSNLAAMVANPEDLVHGNPNQGSTVMTSSKAIQAWRDAAPSGKGNTVAATGTKGD